MGSFSFCRHAFSLIHFVEVGREEKLIEADVVGRKESSLRRGEFFKSRQCANSASEAPY
jgi:hypothetical protein